MARLCAAFDQLEATHRLADAEALLQTTRDAALDENDRLWVGYLRARLDRAALRLDEAAEQIDDILARPALDPALAAEARQTLGEICAETGQWARATELYRDSLGYFEATGKPYQAAEVMLRLGEAYEGLGMSTGGWHVPAYPQSRFWRTLGQAWNWSLALPFRLVAAFLRRTPWTLPRSQHLASYQNWLLVRLYRTAQGWYERAGEAFRRLGDDAGMLRAEQHLAEILLIFGYEEDALAQLDGLRDRPPARDLYTRAWIDCARAMALLAKGRTAEVQPLLDEALARFREIGDLRREAAVLALQARAAEALGADDAALEGYRSSLARYRALRYAAAREQALYALRAWRRRVGPGPLSNRIGELLAQEPEKRYVARFPRSQLPLLQVLSIVAVPLALLMLALLLPDQVVRPVAGSQLPALLTSYSLSRGLEVLAVLLLLYSAAYTLAALAVIFFIPIAALEREQPDYLITNPEGIARYDYRGALAERIDWAEIRRWIRVDRRLWERPLPLVSMTFLEANDGRDLRIDGITGWYTSVQADIEQHARAVGNPITSEDLGFSILRSRMGLLVALGAPLLVLFLAAESGWADWLLRLLPPEIYALCSLVVFSGVLLLIPLAYWLVTRPLALRRTLTLAGRWPQIIGVVGLGAIALYFMSSGSWQQSRALYVGLLLWGAYVVADVIATLLAPSSRLVRAILVAAALVVAAAIAAPRIETMYYAAVSHVAAQNALEEPSRSGVAPGPSPGSSAQQAVDAADAIVQQPLISPEQKAQAARANIDKGNAYYAVHDYESAANSYDAALMLYQQLSEADSADLHQEIAVALAGRARSLEQLGSPTWRQDLMRACEFDRAVAPECSQ
jgi:tetratricopeptide (TPR) repeat protein